MANVGELRDFIQLGDSRITLNIREEVSNNYDLIYGKINWHLIDGNLRVTSPLPAADLYFATSNEPKVNSARRSLGDKFSVRQVALKISEEQNTIEEIAAHKARVAYAVLCRPVIVDDSGLIIPSLAYCPGSIVGLDHLEKLGEWPGARVGRELQRLGEQRFAELFKDGPREAYFVMAVTYFDQRLSEPKTFISTVNGHLQYEKKGDPEKPFIKNKILGPRFIVRGQSKTLAEMTDEEYNRDATTDRWRLLKEFLESRSVSNK